LNYRLQVSGNLKDWDDVPSEDREESGHEIKENGIESVDVYMRSNSEPESRFYRIKVDYLN
jgi:hypothetical protein